MKAITRYESIDGTIFDSEDNCVSYDKLVESVNEIMSFLSPLPKDEDCRFGNGKGYIQQNKEIVDLTKDRITNIVNLTLNTSLTFNSMGRILDDSNIRVLNSAWVRLSNIDHLYREWGQPYYAINPTKGVQKEYVE